MLVLTERFWITQFSCVWDYTATDQFGCPCWTLSTAESTNNGHVCIRTRSQSNGRRWIGLMSDDFFYIKWMARGHLRLLPGEHMASNWPSKLPRSQSNRASVGCDGQTSPVHGDSTSPLTRLTGFAADILAPDTTAHLQGSLMGHGCFGRRSLCYAWLVCIRSRLLEKTRFAFMAAEIRLVNSDSN